MTITKSDHLKSMRRVVGIALIACMLMCVAVWQIGVSNHDDTANTNRHIAGAQARISTNQGDIRDTEASLEKTQRGILDNQRVQCEHSKISRAYMIADAYSRKSNPLTRGRRARRIFPIVNCAATLRLHHPVPLSLAAQNAFIQKHVPPISKDAP